MGRSLWGLGLWFRAISIYCIEVITPRLHSSSFSGLPSRIPNMNHKEELPWSLWVINSNQVEGFKTLYCRHEPSVTPKKSCCPSTSPEALILQCIEGPLLTRTGGNQKPGNAGQHRSRKPGIVKRTHMLHGSSCCGSYLGSCKENPKRNHKGADG